MIFDFVSNLIEGLIFLINKLGYLGIFFGMVLESSVFPLPSEAILIPAGVLITQGKMNFLSVFLSGIFGSFVGALISYLFALWFGRKTTEHFINKNGKFIFLEKESLLKTENYFKKHGSITVLISRLIPVARHLISLPAGFSKMNYLRFSIFTIIGASLWSLILILLGIFLGSSANLYLKFITGFVFLICLIVAFIYFKRKKF